ncbi:hypothetical protein MYSTI_04268 [Myxococcus stipitatus DSM 14675]|uniref:Uncharacterized protein n=1 Tax=Myxococcus stipitatus (strain DSM 14675 / JCM 12634 / Mx s8) TaxID=1278073 RepID=L7U9F9_MYXSD|nr:hypothetical protein [Myxococcus stipitatus]AGC45566.1 hypothetical protein MYSTI_04268 [Myxococcus stipitatus DSM 14675]
MKSQRNIHRPFTVEIAAAAWSQVARLSRERYRAIQARLEEVAALGAVAEESGCFQLEELTIYFHVDTRRRLVSLMDIIRDKGCVPKSPARPSTTRAS